MSEPEQASLAPDGFYTLRLQGAKSMSAHSTQSDDPRQSTLPCPHCGCRCKMAKLKRFVDDLEGAFWQRVNKEGVICPDLGRCWLWTGGKFNHGYGQLRVLGQITLASRFSWELHFGPIPDGLHVLHRCDVAYPVDDITYRLCVNPDHLFLGTQADNNRDMWNKGRNVVVRGERAGNSKLKEEQVREIRRRYRQGSSTDGLIALGKEYGVRPTTIHWIVKRLTWKHVD